MESEREMIERSNDYAIASSWDRVKGELLNRYYTIMDYFREYQYYVLSKRDHEEVRKKMTALLSNFWLQMRSYKKSYKSIKNFDRWDKDMVTVTKKKQIMSYDCITVSVLMVSDMAKEGGLTEIEFEKPDPNKAITEGQY